MIGCAGAFHDVVNVLLSPNNVPSTSMSKFPFEASIAISSRFKPANGSSPKVCGLFCWKAHEVDLAQEETLSSSANKFRFAAKLTDPFVLVTLWAPLLLFVSPCKTRFLSCLSPSTCPLVCTAMRGAINWCRPSVCGVSGSMSVVMRGSMFCGKGGTEWLRFGCKFAVTPLVSWLHSVSSSCSEGKWSRKFGVADGIAASLICWKRQSVLDELQESKRRN